MDPTKRIFKYTAESLPCDHCGEVFLDTDPVIEFGSKKKRWHVQCFVCKSCKQVIPQNALRVESVDDTSLIEGYPYCEKCYNKLFAGTKCGGCGQLISGQYAKIGAKSYHVDCFKCSNCGGGLSGGYAMRGNQALCKNCIGGRVGFVVDPKTGKKREQTTSPK